MTDLYLILHKVRGEPAFDIACKLQIGDEEGWIIPTSGHRAYPLWQWELDGLGRYNDYGFFPPSLPEIEGGEAWEALPDHYEVGREPTVSEAKLAQALLDSLGITPEPKQKFVRR